MDSVFFIKVISMLLYPLGLVSLFLILSLICRFRGRATGAKSFALAAIVILFLSTNPLVARSLVSNLEKQYPQLDLDAIALHDVIIVLGGGLRIPLPPAKHVQLSRGSDRYWYAAALYQAGKAKKIFLSGGNVYEQPGLFGEAYYAAQLLQQWGVPESAISFESSSRTTSENRQNTLALIEANDIKSALLVTSGMHMPRAYNFFRRLPIQITPASADVLIRDQKSHAIFSYLPSASALNLTTMAMHEYYGLWYHTLRRAVFGV